MDGTQQSPSLPRRLGSFLRRQWPLVAFVLVAVGSRCLTPVLWHENPEWALGTLGIAAPVFLLKKFHLERRLSIYILPFIAYMLFRNILFFIIPYDHIYTMIFPQNCIFTSLYNSFIAAICSLPCMPFFFKSSFSCRTLFAMVLLMFSISLALWSLYAILIFIYVLAMLFLGIAR